MICTTALQGREAITNVAAKLGEQRRELGSLSVLTMSAVWHVDYVTHMPRHPTTDV